MSGLAFKDFRSKSHTVVLATYDVFKHKNIILSTLICTLYSTHELKLLV
jgi:hypothetical protein